MPTIWLGCFFPSVVDGMYGWAKAKTRKIRVKMRAIRMSSCFNLDLFFDSFFMSFRKLTLLKYTVLYCLKLNRWIIMGIAMVKSAKRNAGKRNFIIEFSIFY
jgi:hypothetical protein